CALRSVASVTGLSVDHEAVVEAAARISWGFRAYVNSPEVTGVLDQSERSGSAELAYWRRVARHGVAGNLQALLDEHLHVLRDWLGFTTFDTEEQRVDAAGRFAERLHDALDVRTASFQVDVPQEDEAGGVSFAGPRMRSRFAAAFGNQRMEEGGEQRVEAVSNAFNSPFWPFVLTSTSVGQEGLDFHLWCHAVVHWNLPSNPVDLEQREGRVHRYKGHAVRRNIAGRYADEGPVVDGDLWEALFARAAGDLPTAATEMQPYWVFAEGDARILRFAPFPPYSREAALLPRLRRSLAAYRLAFGQPRQEELVEFLGRALDPEQLQVLVERLRIDLSPPRAEPLRCANGEESSDER
ncbi:MAG: hypothetical protein KC656_32865, partial [Myxococcales bacterium]|nr:hypothetical protein [Myxococcales bacterium]